MPEITEPPTIESAVLNLINIVEAIEARVVALEQK